ncbi:MULTISPECIES: type I polyketide synthase [unclassified Bacillus (in: firmicutes)]|uniref:type I polyketide synthase n=1 Tax=unclassified Bacillus (in: firmicutes) TaxID=185979 RepID=UPI0008E6A061|nr:MULTISPECIES: type I polyketide synthase [unclassified Bacillus (in: firmicutes)]SFI32157.1 Acyl transferase domain-containing protein [Bacillus sp. 71mf]SFS37282.1 Acyl transferase domain-containing protein [Bacillus sp. 103mf]
MSDEKSWTESGLEVAVIGLAGKFPGAKNINAYWENISKGKESVTFFSDEELKEAGVTEKFLQHADYVKAKPIIDNVSKFDADFFGYSPREATLMDPQIRMMHECTWEALEHAGCDPERYDGSIGLYAGASSNLSWMGEHLSSLQKNEDTFQIMNLNHSSFASRIAYKLNLKGPSVSVQTACSTSLVAIHMACQGLIGGECDLALAGGVSLNLPHKTGYFYQEGMIYSPDGHCRPFDKKAQGTIFGEGVGVVALKRLKDAKEDGDFIYAVIKGSAINNDGNNKAGFTAPSVEGQASVIGMAMEMAGIEPDSIGYIEAHGTGTPIGDPIEIEALTRAFKTDRKAFCALGSVKANIGHLDAASGVAGLIKTVMMLHHKKFVPALHFEKPNPSIRFQETPFYVNTELKAWDLPHGPRRAGVSAFGIGGANAHVILEESPNMQEESKPKEEVSSELILISARTKNELMKLAENLRDYVHDHPEIPLSQIAHTLKIGRKYFKHRYSLVCSSTQELQEMLNINPLKINETVKKIKNKSFILSGESQERLRSYMQLYRLDRQFQEEVNTYLRLSQAVLDEDINGFFAECFANPQKIGMKHTLGLSYVVMFIMEYASSCFLQKNGIKPDKLIGRGFGEFTAACVAGVFKLEDAISIAYKRGELISYSPTGKMIGIPLSEQEISPYLENTLSLALIEAKYCVVSGIEEDVRRLEECLKEQAIHVDLLDMDCALQSVVMREAADELFKLIQSVPLNQPKIPLVSSVTGKILTNIETVDAQYWASQICKPIRFSQTIKESLKEENIVYIDLRLLTDSCVFTSYQVADSLENISDDTKSGNFILSILGMMWKLGVDIDFTTSKHSQHIKKVPLPTYPFTRKDFAFPNVQKDIKLNIDQSEIQEFVSFMPLSSLEKEINLMIRNHFGFRELDDQVPFFELGASSLDISQLAVKLTEKLQLKVETVLLYQFSTVNSLAKHLHQKYKKTFKQRKPPSRANENQVDDKELYNQSDIAIIGMAGRFPGASTLEEFWNNLVQGKESISFFNDEELKASGVDENLMKHPNFVNAKGIVENIDMFDADFFQYSSREAELMDPQFRLLHECAWEALEDGGCDPERVNGKIGVFTGTSPNFEWINRSAANLKGTEQFSSMLLNDREFFSTQLAYKLNLHGPSITMQTACSTSLVNIGMACQALLNGSCDAALAGGITVGIPHKSGYIYQDGMIQSPDGHCRPFDGDAKGTVFGDGAGIVLLKRYEDAVKEGHTIHAVIKGIGINNDGSRKVGFTAPSVEGQADAIREAYKSANIDPQTIGYIETHGTGTQMGDPIEIEALGHVFANKNQPLIPIGSVKSNVGHLNSAAGIAGLFKAVLALKYKTIPPSLNYKTPNKNINFAETPFYVTEQAMYWKESDYPRRAGVSSFGIGGTNAHIVIEEPINQESMKASRNNHLLLLSAKTETALETMTDNLKDFIRKHPKVPIEDIAHSLQVGRKQFPYRKTVVFSNKNEWIDQGYTGHLEMTGVQSKNSRTVAFMFSGQGSQYTGMLKDLYQEEIIFRQEVDYCFDYVRDNYEVDLKRIVFSESNETESLTQTSKVQPLLFIFEYALAKLLQSFGIIPDYMIGHSIGEYTAACLSGVFSLETALDLVVMRGKLMQSVKPGAMMSVALSEEELLPMLYGNLSIAAVNAQNLCVVSGEKEDINRFEAQLTEKGIVTRHLHTSHAFHSYMMEPVLQEFEKVIKELDLQKPRIPYISNLTGTWIDSEQVLTPAYWTEHLRETVRFYDGLEQILKDEHVTLIEIGPGNSLTALAKRHQKRTNNQEVLNIVRHVHEKANDHVYFLKCLGRLWMTGCEIDWQGYYKNETRKIIHLPTYPFEKKKYWIEANKLIEIHAFDSSSEDKKKPMDEWFYLPSWERKPQCPRIQHDKVEIDSQQNRVWLIFYEETDFSDQLIRKIEQDGEQVVIVKKGVDFEEEGELVYKINPAKSSHYKRLLESIELNSMMPNRVIHLWGISDNDEIEQDIQFQVHNESGYYSLIFLAQAAGIQKNIKECRIFILTSNIHEVTGDEHICAAKATVLGPCKVISQEYSHIKCWNIDIAKPSIRITWKEEDLLKQIWSELKYPGKDQLIAYRNGRRWVQNYKKMSLAKEGGLPKMIRSGGTYLITGGLGGIGFVLSKMLAKTGGVQLVLTGRSALPPRDQWESWMNKKGEKDPITVKIKKIKELERLGSRVTVLQADSGNLHQMQAVFKEIHATYGQLNGVFHAAGLPGSTSFRAIKDIPKEIDQGEDQFQSKVKGLTVLGTLLRREEVDFCLLFSSISSLLGGLGFSAYSAANIYMDAFAQRMNQESKTPWICINFDAWNFWGEHDSTLGESITNLAIMPEEGADLFSYLLSDVQNRHILISTGDLEERINQWTSFETRTLLKEEKKTSIHTRPDLKNPYVAPRNRIEQVICQIFQDFLGLEQVGIHDNFFDLGANSLDIVQITNRVNKELGTNEAVVTLFTYPSVAELAQHLNPTQEDSNEDYEKEVVLAGLDSRKNRVRNQRNKRLRGGDNDEKSNL